MEYSPRRYTESINSHVEEISQTWGRRREINVPLTTGK
jgi:hypothetical protein